VKYDSADELIWALKECRRVITTGQIGDAGIIKMCINECCIEVTECHNQSK